MPRAPADATIPSPPVPRAPAAVSIEGAVKRFGKATALEGVSLRIAQGEFLTLLGPSGCGKTTLLNLVAGFTEPDEGEIFIDGQLVTQTPPHLREIGIVFQNYALFPHMTVAQNIGYGLRMRKVPRDEIARRVAQVQSLVRLEGFGERRPRELSGGQQQRVALARALVIGPKVLLLDEPFSALDKSLRGSMQVEVKEIVRKLGVTTIFVTHDQSEALSMSDRIAVMSQGRIRQIADPFTIYRQPADPFVATFVGDVNVLSARCVGRTAESAMVQIGTGAWEVPAANIAQVEAGMLVDLYVRPEAIHLQALHAHTQLTGTVVHHIFQGDHVDIYLDLPGAVQRRVLVRGLGAGAARSWPLGAVAGLDLQAEDISAFPAAGA